VSKCSHLSILSCLTCIGKQWRHDLWFLRWLFSERMTQVATTGIQAALVAVVFSTERECFHEKPEPAVVFY
jgi:hypothetical protein